MSTKVTSSAVNIPQQKRSREKFEAMIRAAEKLFTERGVEHTSVQDIVKEAGVSVGAFYQRFKNKEALIHSIFYLLEDEVFPKEEDVEVKAGQTLEKTIEKIIVPSMKLYHTHKGLLLAMMLESQRNEDINNYVSGLRSKVTKLYALSLKPHRKEIKHKNFNVATAMVMRIISSYLDQYLLWSDHPEAAKELSYERSDKELVKVLTSYLRQG